MKSFKIVLIALFAVVLFSCNQKPKQVESQQESVQENVAYFRHIQFTETPWDIEKGTHSLTAEEAQSVNNYKFTY